MRNYPGIAAEFLTGKVVGAIKGAVATLNWMRDFCGNLKGDADVSTDGAITVDVSDPHNPVIRLTKATGGGSLEITDNQPTPVTLTVKRLTLAADSRTNIQFALQQDPNDSDVATLTVGVYYK